MKTPLALLVLVFVTAIGAFASTGGIWHEVAVLESAAPVAGERLGSWVALDHTTAAVSGGSVEVWTRESSGWQRQDTLQPDVGSLHGAVALQGDRVVVGDIDWQVASGRVVVFERNGAIWSELQALDSDPSAQQGLFGSSAAMAGDDLVVGAPTYLWFGGLARVYHWDGTQYVFQQEFVPGGRSAGFGWDVAIDGDRMAIGCPGYTVISGFSSYQIGAIYLYERDGSGTWIERQVLAESSMLDYANVGIGVALEGDTLAVGASVAGEGVVRIYRHDGTSFQFDQELAPAAATRPRGFGSALDLDGDLLLVGAAGCSTESGAAYVFRRMGSSWVELERLSSSSSVALDSFGQQVALDGTRLLIGAPLAGGSEEGEAQLLEAASASATVRNAGANPATYSAPPLVLGATWTPTVDVAASGHDSATVVVFPGPSQVTLRGGQVLLGQGPDIAKLPLQSGPIASWSVPIPADIAYLGTCVTTQAVLFGSGVPFALSNAIDLFGAY